MTLLNKIILQVLKVLCFNLLLFALFFCFDEFPGKGTKKGKQATIPEENIKDFAVIRGYISKASILISFSCPLFVEFNIRVMELPQKLDNQSEIAEHYST